MRRVRAGDEDTASGESHWERHRVGCGAGSLGVPGDDLLICTTTQASFDCMPHQGAVCVCMRHRVTGRSWAATITHQHVVEAEGPDVEIFLALLHI
jgi:hypothetical protein